MGPDGTRWDQMRPDATRCDQMGLRCKMGVYSIPSMRLRARQVCAEQYRQLASDVDPQLRIRFVPGPVKPRAAALAKSFQGFKLYIEERNLVTREDPFTPPLRRMPCAGTPL